MSRIKNILTKHKLRVKKRLGQNFLQDTQALEQIVEYAKISGEDSVLEIGAGIGNLSTLIAEKAGQFFAVEKDRALEAPLKESLNGFNNTQIIIADILKFDISAIAPGKKLKIVGNLPYYITSPILNYLIDRREFIQEIYITVQKEVAQRIIAKPGTKDYGRLTCLLQFYAKPEILKIFPKQMFFPKPEVDSAFLKLPILDNPSVEVRSEKVFFNVVKAIFAQRRKTLLNGLSNAGWKLNKQDILKILEKIGISGSIRGEKLSLKEIAKIANSIDSFV